MANLSANPRFIGIDRERDASELSAQHATDALNVNLDRGTIQKRDGYTEETDFGADSILGIFDFRRDDGSIQTLIKHGNDLHVRETTTNTTLSTGLDATELASFAVHSDRAYYVDGTNLYVTDGTAAGTRSAQLLRPASAATTATTSSGVLSGTYDYKWTYYSSTFGQESPASDASATVAPDGQQVALSGFTASTDSDVDTIRIYRRKESANETLWFYLDEMDDTVSTYTDNTLDVDVSTTDISPLSYTDSLPGFRYLEQHSGVMFLAGDDDKLYFTLPDKPWSVTNFIRVGGDGGVGKITGLKSFQGLLVVFKEHSIWTLSGITSDTFNARLILNGVGCVGGHSIVPAGNLLYFLGEDGFYVFDGARAVKISDPVESDLIGRNRSRDKYVVGADDEENSAILWTYSGSGSSTNNKVYAFFYGNTGQTQQQSWCPWEFDQDLTYLARITTDATSRDRKVWYGFANGVIGEPGGSSDNTSAIEFKWQTSKWDGEVPHWQKAWGEVQVELVPQSNYSYLELRYYRDSETSYDFLEALDPLDPIHSLRISDRSRDLRLEFYQNASQPVEIVSFNVEARRAGRALV